ncbi:Poxvirus C4/C10 protein [Gimesia alba]|uniref:Poxvirus C4/C10 protein n=1 Tax=Gimesia alba TaxID=2527973 RepID=A0A517RIF1_9PLAN|nr:2OG-Fe(II) oxygenase [Gimesia alba]QDT43658.1 Poxvirus C4/C10 protein [Gimesia alba]
MREENWLNDYVFTVENFLTPEECEKYIRISEDFGYEDALVSSPRGQVLRKDVRNNERVMFQNDEIAAWLWERACEFVPQEFEDRAAVGVNEMLRFYRYDPGQQFNWHQDFPYERDNGEQSYLTLLIYLIDDFEGGETSFEDSYSDEIFEEFMVVPKQGMALFFEHAIHHKGEPVTQGRKYVLRTDVMYAAEDAEYDYEDEIDDEW